MILSFFMLNLFCSYFSCDYKYDKPESGRNTDSILRRRDAMLVPPIVQTGSGAVEGYSMFTAGQREIFAFEGIPYGQALRFKPPKRRPPWNGILRAMAPGPYCVQLNMAHIPQIFGKEDCLFLNIYTPKIRRNSSTDEDLLPVLVYFHGGGFAAGAGHDIGPAYLLDQDIVLVTVSYRLGVLGFLSTGDSSSPGNYGLKDQSLSLEWIHDNIIGFSGNNSLVTLFGNSAGAASVHLHMLSNRTRKYFSAGVSSSGTAFNPWAIQTKGQLDYANNKLAKVTRCKLKNSSEFVNCLRRMNVFKLVGKQSSIYDAYQLPAVLFGPVVEQPSKDAFLTESPREIYRRNAVAPYPWISTSARDECEGFIMLLDTFGIMAPVVKKWSNMSSLILDCKYRYSQERAHEITETVSQYYFGDEGPKQEEGQLMGQLWSDRYFNYPAHEAVLAHSKIAPTYTAIFGYKGRPSVSGYLGLNRTKWGVVHGEDEFFYFNRSTAFPTFKTKDPDYPIVRFMTSTIANFARTREPFYKDGNGKIIRVWDKVQNSDRIQSLLIDKEIRMVEEPHQSKFKFWEGLNLT